MQMPVVNGKQRRYLGSPDRTGRQFVDGKIVVTEIQLHGASERRRRAGRSERQQSVGGELSARRRRRHSVIVVDLVVGGK